MIGLLQLGTGSGNGMCVPIVSSGLLVWWVSEPETRAVLGESPPVGPEALVAAPAVPTLVPAGLLWPRLAALAAERCCRDRDCVPVGLESANAVCAAVPDAEEDPTAPAEAALATGSELVPSAVLVGDVVTPPLGALGVLPPAGDSEDSATGVVGEVELVPELDTSTLGVEALTLGVVTLTTGVVTVTLGTVTVTLGTDTPTEVSPRSGRLGKVIVGNVTAGSVTLGSERSTREALPDAEAPAWLAPEDEPRRDDSSPFAWASAHPSARNVAQMQTSVTAAAIALPRKRAAAIFSGLAQSVNERSCAGLRQTHGGTPGRDTQLDGVHETGHQREPPTSLGGLTTAVLRRSERAVVADGQRQTIAFTQHAQHYVPMLVRSAVTDRVGDRLVHGEHELVAAIGVQAERRRRLVRVFPGHH
jgi:hypothetical protein